MVIVEAPKYLSHLVAEIIDWTYPSRCNTVVRQRQCCGLHPPKCCHQQIWNRTYNIPVQFKNVPILFLGEAARECPCLYSCHGWGAWQYHTCASFYLFSSASTTDRHLSPILWWPTMGDLASATSDWTFACLKSNISAPGLSRPVGCSNPLKSSHLDSTFRSSRPPKKWMYMPSQALSTLCVYVSHVFIHVLFDSSSHSCR